MALLSKKTYQLITIPHQLYICIIFGREVLIVGLAVTPVFRVKLEQEVSDDEMYCVW